jgi:hypothetical protein
MNLSWLVLSWALTLGWLPTSGRVFVGLPGDPGLLYQDTYSTKFELSAEALNHLRVWGSVETLEGADGIASFMPYEAYYRAGAALYARGFEVGIEHECDHGIEASYQDNPWYWGGYTEIYIKISGRTGG